MNYKQYFRNDTNTQERPLSALLDVAFILLACLLFAPLVARADINAIEAQQTYGVSGQQHENTRKGQPNKASAQANASSASALYDFEKAIEALRSAIKIQDQQGFEAILSDVISHATPYDPKKLTAMTSDPKLTVWYRLRSLIPFAFAQRSDFATGALLGLNIHLDDEFSITQNTIRAVSETQNLSAVQAYMDSVLFKDTKANISELFQALIRSRAWDVIESLDTTRFSAVQSGFYSQWIANTYHKNDMDTFRHLIEVPYIREAMRASKTHNLAFSALAKNDFETVDTILRLDALHPQQVPSLVAQWAIAAIRGGATNAVLDTVFKWQKPGSSSQAFAGEVFDGILMHAQNDAAATHLTRYVLHRDPALLQQSEILQVALARAIQRGYIQLTTYLLEQKVSPSSLDFGATLIEIAQRSPQGNTPEMVAVLKKYGVASNYLDAVIRERNGEPVASCALAQSTPLDEVAFQDPIGKVAGDTCADLLVTCGGKGHKVEACIRSAPTCSQHIEGGCCDTEFQQKFLTYYCAGLTSEEALKVLATQ